MNNNHNQTENKQQFQWIGMIFQILPNIKINLSNTSFLQLYYNILTNKYQNKLQNKQQSINQRPIEIQSPSNKHEQSTYQILHLLGNFMNLVIQSRTTTQIIQTFSCPIQDVKQMYNQPHKQKLCNLKLKLQDVIYLCKLLKKYVKMQKQLYKKLFINKHSAELIENAQKISDKWIIMKQDQNQYNNIIINKNNKNSQQQQQHNIITNGDIIMQIMYILTQSIFLGGYSPKIQTIIFNNLFQNNFLPQFLQINFIVYSERRFLGKSSNKINLAKAPQTNLYKLLEINQHIQLTLSQKHNIYKIIAYQIKSGRLSLNLRLLTNLIHINNEALNYFQKNIKYLHLIMSLTHQSQFNVTMKNWAVLFIKSACDSQLLRSQIDKVKIQMKIQ